MLLNIERVLKMLAEGKSVEKIAESAEVEAGDVRAIIEEALDIVMKYEKPRAKKKIIIKKSRSRESSEGARDAVDDEIFNGAEFTAIPLGAVLTIYTDGASSGNPGHAGIGIVIYDAQNRQVGKVSQYLGVQTNNYAEYTAVIRALRIAAYFKAKNVRIRTDSELVVKQINGQYRVKNENIRPLYESVMDILRGLPSVKLEHVTRNLNDKADYLAKKAAERRGLE